MSVPSHDAERVGGFDRLTLDLYRVNEASADDRARIDAARAMDPALDAFLATHGAGPGPWAFDALVPAREAPWYAQWTRPVFALAAVGVAAVLALVLGPILDPRLSEAPETGLRARGGETVRLVVLLPEGGAEVSHLGEVPRGADLVLVFADLRGRSVSLVEQSATGERRILWRTIAPSTPRWQPVPGARYWAVFNLVPEALNTVPGPDWWAVP